MARTQVKRSAQRPTVGGEPAKEIARMIRGFPVMVDGAGDVYLERNIAGQDLAMFRRAYEAVEYSMLVEEERCDGKAFHRRLHPDERVNLVLQDMMRQCRAALGQTDRFEALWMESG